MPTKLRRVSFYADPALLELLKAERSRTGAPLSELIRRAVRLSAFADAQTKVEIRRNLPPGALH